MKRPQAGQKGIENFHGLPQRGCVRRVMPPRHARKGHDSTAIFDESKPVVPPAPQPPGVRRNRASSGRHPHREHGVLPGCRPKRFRGSVIPNRGLTNPEAMHEAFGPRRLATALSSSSKGRKCRIVGTALGQQRPSAPGCGTIECKEAHFLFDQGRRTNQRKNERCMLPCPFLPARRSRL